MSSSTGCPARFIRLHTTAVLASGAIFSCIAHAEITSKLSGFGTAAVAHSSIRSADFTSSNNVPDGAGFSRRWDFKGDSVLGLQEDITVGETLSLAIQGIAQQNFDGNFKPKLNMAFAKWRATPEISLRAGRLMLPVFLISDYRNVGYSQVTLRPPSDLYRQFGFNHFDGIDGAWTRPFGSVATKSHLYLGTIANVNEVGGQKGQVKRLWGFDETIDIDSVTARFSYLSARRLSVHSTGLDEYFGLVRDGAPEGALGEGSPAVAGDPALASRYRPVGKTTDYTSAGLSYDPGNWFVTSEVGYLSQTSVIPSRKIAYVTGGVRLGKWTPYLMVSKIKPRAATSPTGNPLVDALLSSETPVGERIAAAGVRWDALKSVDLKLEIANVKPDTGSSGQLTNVQSAYRLGSAYNLLSASLDFVF